MDDGGTEKLEFSPLLISVRRFPSFASLPLCVFALKPRPRTPSAFEILGFPHALFGIWNLGFGISPYYVCHWRCQCSEERKSRSWKPKQHSEADKPALNPTFISVRRFPPLRLCLLASLR